jgi:hypothetical protein
MRDKIIERFEANITRVRNLFNPYMFVGSVAAILLCACTRAPDDPQADAPTNNVPAQHSSAQTSATVPTPAASKVARPFPSELFGIELDGEYELGPSNETGTFPVKHITGVETSFGVGNHMYFEPLKENQNFRFRKKNKTPTDQYFRTSHHIYAYFVFPDRITTTEQLNDYITNESQGRTKWHVVNIDWDDELATEAEGYGWVSNMCASVEADIERTPETVDQVENHFFHCTFKEGNRELKIYTYGYKSVFISLRHSKEASDAEEKRYDQRFRKLEMEKIRPY